jgi:hypothetical protein
MTRSRRPAHHPAGAFGSGLVCPDGQKQESFLSCALNLASVVCGQTFLLAARGWSLPKSKDWRGKSAGVAKGGDALRDPRPGPRRLRLSLSNTCCRRHFCVSNPSIYPSSAVHHLPLHYSVVFRHCYTSTYTVRCTSRGVVEEIESEAEFERRSYRFALLISPPTTSCHHNRPPDNRVHLITANISHQCLVLAPAPLPSLEFAHL